MTYTSITKIDGRRRKNESLLCSTGGYSDNSVFAAAEVLDQMFGSPQRKGQDADGGRLVGAVQKNAGVAYVKIRHVMRLAKTVGNEILRIVSHATSAALVQAKSGNLGLSAETFKLASGRA